MYISGNESLNYDLKPECVHCIAKAKEFALLLQYFQRGLYILNIDYFLNCLCIITCSSTHKNNLLDQVLSIT